ncbi:MAG TPA: hypothetical protein VEK08_13805 [Planctomycetota bacterium]|nr:hypothetical protein [Planctomycetota bacterium]
MNQTTRGAERKPRIYLDLTVVACILFLVFILWLAFHTPEDTERKRRELEVSERASRERRENDRRSKAEKELLARKQQIEQFKQEAEELREFHKKRIAEAEEARILQKEALALKLEREIRRLRSQKEAEALQAEREASRLSLHVLDQEIETKIAEKIDPDHILRLKYWRMEAALEAYYRECSLIVRYLEENDLRLDECRATLTNLAKRLPEARAALSRETGLADELIKENLPETALRKLAAVQDPPREFLIVLESIADAFEKRAAGQKELAEVQKLWYAAREKLIAEKPPPPVPLPTQPGQSSPQRQPSQKPSEQRTVKITTYTLKNGRRILGVQSVDSGDSLSVKSVSGKFHLIKKDDIERIEE